MKFLLERLFGKPVWYRLKETGDIRKWQKETIRLLRAIDLSIKSTVQIVDDQWCSDVSNIITEGIKDIERAKHIDTLLSDLAATLVQIVFVQIGNMPYRYSHTIIPLTASNWKFDGFRSVQYVETAGQRAAVRRRQRRPEDNAKRAAELDKD